MSTNADENLLTMLHPAFPLTPPRMSFLGGLTMFRGRVTLELAIGLGGGTVVGGGGKILIV